MARLLRLLLLLVVAGPCLAAAPCFAAESAPVRSERATATLISDTDAVEAGKPFRIGLRLRLAPGWHTYWQNPGDAGAAPELTLSLPEGTRAGPIDWPVPVRLREGPLMTYAYTGEVVLPLTVTPGPGAQQIKAAANWLVCEKICVPEEGSFTLDLPQGRPAPSAESALFAAAAARTPRTSPFAASVAPDGTLTLSGEGLSPATVQDAWFFPATAGAVEDAAPAPVSVRDGAVQIGLKPGSEFAPGTRLAGVVVLRDRGGQESYWAVAAEPGRAASGSSTPLWQTLGLAWLAGLILNLMPCVFPVLAMKAMALARLSGAATGAVRAHAASYTAGVLLAFGALGGLLLALRAGGQAAGWGFQFQSPVFVACMAWVLFLVGLNLSGVFEVSGRVAGAGQGLAARGGHAGSFFTGLLAVVVATPCTAPFMATAIAAALAAPVPVTELIFLAMGLGLATPYLILALVPGSANVLPRPGRWMDLLRGALAFPMYAASAWLVWVISVQAGPAGVLPAAAGMVLLGFAAWVVGASQGAQPRGRRLGGALALTAVLGAAACLGAIESAPSATAQASAGDAEPFTPARLAALREEGRPIFVNLTAAWCVTCLVNERIALSPEPIRRAFARHRVAYLKGDWTRGDSAVTAMLRASGRDGVPLYLLYRPGDSTPRVLPQILTQSEVLSELERLGG